ncbi:peptide chain release factor 1 [Candidatus Falkowbacteria bacterium]|nr:peptide chain release factor 1 [Candidatus Falkowbacteria bacterium]NCT55149.1 peptide chain release factor 1 [Candidatus Falkowbacteria bacterium]
MYEEVKAKFKELETRLIDSSSTQTQQEMIKISQEHAALKRTLDLILSLEKTNSHLEQSRQIINEEQDPELRQMAETDLAELELKSESLKDAIEEEINPSSPNDKKNAIIEIRAGAGGDEAALFAGDLFRMYARFCEKKSWKLELIDASEIGIGGYKEIIFSVKGAGAYGLLKFEAGTHRVQRVPETEKQGRVHTSTATVVVLPEAEEVDIEIKAQDIRIDTFCSSGPGGQSVNTTYSAIRVLHLPTGIIVSCQDQKSQHQNKEKALQVLRSRLLAKEEEERRQKESDTRQIQVGGGDRSDKIRTYNVPQDRVTDHRINTSWHSITRILEGEIEEIVISLKKASREKK